MTEQNKKLGQCSACQGMVSKTAKSCPHCGQKKPYKKSIPAIAWVLLILLIIAMANTSNKPPPSIAATQRSNNASYEQSSEEETKPIPSNVSAALVANAHERCISAIQMSVNNPSTLDIHTVTGYASKTLNNGVVLITQTFSAKNGFGLEKTYDAFCTVGPEKKFDMKTVEHVGR